jgi:hypothetical protein
MGNSKISLRLFEISTGLLMAVGVMTIRGLVNSKENTFSNYSGLWFFFYFIISSILIWGRRLKLKPAGKVLSEDQRPSVLYLRSFKDDKITSRLLRESTPLVPFTEEEYLVAVLNDFGPCIAIGQPGERLPDLGAARMYVADDQWQDKVGELLVSSKLVVLRAGQTSNFLWEVEQSIKNVNPLKIIILIPKMKNTYSQFRKLTNSLFPKPLPETIGDPHLYPGAASLYGYLYFDEDWTPHFAKFEFRIPYWKRNMADPITFLLQNSLGPIYERFGILIPKTEGINVFVIGAVFLLPMLALVLLNGYLNQL